jgi:hypothetical protein
MTAGELAHFRVLLERAVDSWPEFDDEDEDVNGGDLVEWFSQWRDEVKDALR